MSAALSSSNILSISACLASAALSWSISVELRFIGPADPVAEPDVGPVADVVDEEGVEDFDTESFRSQLRKSS